MNSVEKEYRYERKFLVDQLDRHQIRALIKQHPNMFYEPYPPRFVNNLYLDTKDLENYEDNVNGAMQRRKVRVRWYGDMLGDVSKATLEFKVKRGLVGAKSQYPFGDFTLDVGFSDKYYHDLLGKSDLPESVKVYMQDLNVVLLNRYYRRYYATRDERYRVTLDTDLTFVKVNLLNNRFLHKQIDYTNLVVELKYLPEHDEQANRVSAYFPFGVTKSSKYVQGIERVYFN